ncbi:alginate lyase family protein [Granulicella arctica]|uniref:Poly(Beta-D-mannuronate) lyase n=1 Tax=Granulicella arctica TaxID=940613 RepID=A0A7Y9TF36_9BACT|nr:alginate lyase family protein [Granulicella arctica]NYF78326.1 poly(beta-D-mannuronate) lyase [Granulicella arctica]
MFLSLSRIPGWGSFLLLLLCVAQLQAHAQSLRSPWEQVPINASAPAFPCPPAIALPQSLVFNGYYTDEHHSIVDPQAKAAYRAASKANELFIKQVAHAADAYQTSRSKAAAQCAVTLLDEAAHQHAFTTAQLGKTGARDGFYVQAFYLDGLSMAYLKVLKSPFVSNQQRTDIQSWLVQMAESVRDFYNSMTRQNAGDSRNNLIYWAGLGVAATGVAADRSDLFDWGIAQYRLGVGQIGTDGTLPLEMDRASMALHYHLFASAPLVLLAELAKPNGIDLYEANNGAIHRLVKVTVRELGNPSFFQQRTGVAQVMPEELDGEIIGWAIPYQRRFPDPVLASLLAKTKSTSYWMMGGNPPN